MYDVCEAYLIFLLIFLLRKSILKLNYSKYFGCRHTSGRHDINISNFLKASHTLVPDEQSVNFHEN